MKNAMQLKAAISKMAKEKHIPAQLVMQNYMLERLLERIAHSRYQGNFILKGGLLIASMVGLHSRATMDMDATIRNHPVNENSIKKMFEEIISIPIDDDITFSFQDVGEIRKNDAYGGYRVSLTANFLPMKVPLKLDITTGDKITPKAVEYKYPMMFNDGTLEIFAYNLETILAEKLETVISRGDQNTRPRDFYDIFILSKLKGDQINWTILRQAVSETAQKRNSGMLMPQYQSILEQIVSSPVMQNHWTIYQRDYEYAREVDFSATCETILQLMDSIQ
ncbi:MAG: nucleotidyl transferase AbiEii/AbiGii toxin family protein [Centipeda sp. (in: firmicutes)]